MERSHGLLNDAVTLLDQPEPALERSKSFSKATDDAP